METTTPATKTRTRPYVVLERTSLVAAVEKVLGTIDSTLRRDLDGHEVLVNVETVVAGNGDTATSVVANGPAYAEHTGEIELVPVSERWFVSHPYEFGSRREVRRKDAA